MIQTDFCKFMGWVDGNYNQFIFRNNANYYISNQTIADSSGGHSFNCWSRKEINFNGVRFQPRMHVLMKDLKIIVTPFINQNKIKSIKLRHFIFEPYTKSCFECIHHHEYKLTGDCNKFYEAYK